MSQITKLFILVVCVILVFVFLITPKDKQKLQVGNTEAFRYFSDRNNLLNVLAVVASLAPPTPPSPTCVAPPLPQPQDVLCDQTALSGEKLSTPRKLVSMMMFSFEVDTLEIALHEMLDIVDIVFLVEATRSHKGEAKPLMWERLKYDQRFSFVNQSRVIHLIVDDIINKRMAKNNMWYAELFQTSVAVQRIKIWNSLTGFLGDDDLLISADVDEVMSRSALLKLKYCETVADVSSAALWMPLGNLNRAMRPDFPVVGHVHSFGVPTIYKWSSLLEGRHSGERLQFKWKDEMKGEARDKFVLGGLHMTDPANLITYMIKELTATETRGFISDQFLAGIGDIIDLETLYMEQESIYNLENKQFWLNRTDPLENVSDVESYVPWWLECNQHRYPYWYGLREPRLSQLYEALLHPELYSMDNFLYLSL